MQQPIHLQKDYTKNASGYQLKLPLNIETIIPKDDSVRLLRQFVEAMNFVAIQEQGFIPAYKRDSVTDTLYNACGFRTDYQFITQNNMKTIQKQSKGK